MGRSEYAVSIVPHWNVACAAVETFDAAVAAFERHAALASHLRRNGWTLAARDAVA
jgi:hypothetical protein